MYLELLQSGRYYFSVFPAELSISITACGHTSSVKKIHCSTTEVCLGTMKLTTTTAAVVVAVVVLLSSLVSTAPSYECRGLTCAGKVHSSCSGTLVFLDQENNRLREERKSHKNLRKHKINLTQVNSVQAEGGCCFKLYNGKNHKIGNGMVYVKPGHMVMREDIDFNVVQSIKKEEC